MTQLVKNPPAMQEPWVGSLGWEDLLEKGKSTHSSILVWRTKPMSPALAGLFFTTVSPGKPEAFRSFDVDCKASFSLC